jgi:subtilisin family serine protease
VAIIDTGVDTRHKDLEDGIVLWKNCIRDNAYKPEIHGTAVAGIIAARINNFGIEGIAPKAKILAFRACRQILKDNPEGECYTVCLARAISGALEEKAKIINISAGSENIDPLLSALIAAGTKQGAIFVAPVGNDPNQKKPSFPASHADVIAVGGIDSQNHYYPNADLAARATIVAPSENIFTTIPGNNHNFLSGTSLSSAIVTGILAVAKEKDKNLDNRRIPPFKQNICKWEEQLLEVPLCGK